MTISQYVQKLAPSANLNALSELLHSLTNVNKNFYVSSNKAFYFMQDCGIDFTAAKEDGTILVTLAPMFNSCDITKFVL